MRANRFRRTLRWLRERRLFGSTELHLSEILTGGSIAFAMKVAGAGLSFIFNIILARILGAEGAGVYYLALTVTTVSSVVGRVGLDNTVLRFVSTNAATENWAGVKGVYRQAILISGSMAVVLTGVLMAAAPWIARTVFGDSALTTPLRIMSLAILPHTAMVLHTQALKGLKRIPEAMALQGFGVPLLGIPLLFALARPFGVVGAAGAWAASTLLIALLGRYLWRRATPQLRTAAAEFSRNLLLATSFPLFLVAAMHLVLSWTDTVVLGIWSSSSDVGVYNVAMRIALLMPILLIAVSSIAAPKFAALFEKGELDQLDALYRDVIKVLSLGALPLLVAFLVIPHLVLRLFGEDFVRGSIALQILAVGQFITVSLGAASHVLIMTGHEKTVRNITIGIASGNLLLNILLVPLFGIVGAATATGLSLACNSVLAALYVRRRVSMPA